MKKNFVYCLILIFSTTLLADNAEHLQRLTVFFTNDIHGGIVPQKAEFLNPEFPPILGGAASAAGIIKTFRKEAQANGGATLLIDGGDTFQGTLVGTLSKGKAVVEYFNMMQYDAVVPGNHDFDLGKDNLAEMIKMSKFPWVSANIYDAETGKPWKWIKPWVIVEKMGLKIGITGATTTGTEVMSFPENIKGLEFRHEITSLQKAVGELRVQGADLVVVLVHTGLPYDPREGYQQLQQKTREAVLQDRAINAMEIARYVKGIDILLGGHLHKGYPEPWVDPVNHTICLQNYANGGNLGVVNIFIDMPTKSIADFDFVADQNDLLLLSQDQFWPDSAVAAFVEKQQDKFEADFREIVGETRTALTRSSIGEAPMNNLITEAMREKVAADFSFMNFGGIRADIKPGPVTREDIFKVLPFGNEIVTFEATGVFIKQIVERKLRGGSRGLAIGGAKVLFNRNMPDGQRVVYMEINGEALSPDKKYRVATSDYLMEGNSGLSMLRSIPRSRVDFQGVLVRDAVIEYIRENSPITVKMTGRWKGDDSARPSPEWLNKFSQAE